MPCLLVTFVLILYLLQELSDLNIIQVDELGIQGQEPIRRLFFFLNHIAQLIEVSISVELTQVSAGDGLLLDDVLIILHSGGVLRLILTFFFEFSMHILQNTLFRGLLLWSAFQGASLLCFDSELFCTPFGS